MIKKRLGNIGFILMKLLKMGRTFQKFAKTVARGLSSMKSIIRFGKKVSSVGDQGGDNSVTGFLGIFMLVTGKAPLALAMIVVSVAFFERTTKIGRITFTSIACFFLVSLSAFLGFNYLICYVIVKKINLGIIYVEFKTTKAFTLTVLAFLISIVSVIAFLVLIYSSREIEFSSEFLK